MIGASSIMTDSLSQADRSALMARVRPHGNKSTELQFVNTITRLGIDGWVMQPPNISGHPDVYFPQQRLVIFLDGCFWHACPKCGRLPKSRTEFWTTKIQNNRRRDQSISRSLRRQGYHVMRLWEHSLRDDRWTIRLLSMLNRVRQN